MTDLQAVMALFGHPCRERRQTMSEIEKREALRAAIDADLRRPLIDRPIVLHEANTHARGEE